MGTADVTIGSIVETLMSEGGWGVAALLILASIKGWITWPSEKRLLMESRVFWRAIAIEALQMGKTAVTVAHRVLPSDPSTE